MPRFYHPDTERSYAINGSTMYATTPGRKKGQKHAKTVGENETTNHHRAMFRGGSYQSATRGWLKPTWMTDSLVRKRNVRTSDGEKVCGWYSLSRRCSAWSIYQDQKRKQANWRRRIVATCHHRHSPENESGRNENIHGEFLNKKVIGRGEKIMAA